MTFQPKINNNHNISISSTFTERNNRLLLLRNHFNTKSLEKPEASILSIEEKQDKELIIKRAIERLYPQKGGLNNKKKNELYNFDNDLRPHVHKLDRDIRISKMSTGNSLSVKNHISSNLSHPFKLQQDSNSLQSYNLTEECNTEEAETVFTTENEDRYVRKENFQKKDM